MSKYGISTRLRGALYFYCVGQCVLYYSVLFSECFYRVFYTLPFRGFGVDECNVSNLFGSRIGHYLNVDNCKGHCSVSKVSNIHMYSTVACLFVNVLIECLDIYRRKCVV